MTFEAADGQPVGFAKVVVFGCAAAALVSSAVPAVDVAV